MALTRWVDTSAALADFVAEVGGAPWLTVDTEFLGDRSYQPRLCLLQVATESVVACVDPLAPGIDLAPLWAVLADPAIVKIFHAGENDIAVLLPLTQAAIRPVFDTQIAAALLGHGPSIGYGNLVRAVLGVELDKSHARTDWSRRPLPRDAIRYAADDVRYLRDLYTVLSTELDRRDRRRWAEEEFARLADPARYVEDLAEVWRRVRGHVRLARADLAVLRELARWRELTAKATNRPRRWVVQDEVLLEIARARPTSEAELAAVPGFDARRHAKDVAAILAMVRHGRGVPPREQPEPVGAPRDTAEAAVLDALQAVVRAVAARSGVPDTMIASSAELLAFARGAPDPAVRRGWRAELAGELLTAFLEGRVTLHLAAGGLELRTRDPNLPS